MKPVGITIVVLLLIAFVAGCSVGLVKYGEYRCGVFGELYNTPTKYLNLQCYTQVGQDGIWVPVDLNSSVR